MELALSLVPSMEEETTASVLVGASSSPLQVVVALVRYLQGLGRLDGVSP